MKTRELLVAVIILPLLLSGCSDLLTEAPNQNEVLDGQVEGLSPAQARAHIAGDEAFSARFTPQTGLGPVFNQTSCESCHPGDGRGHPATNLRRFGKTTANGFDYMREHGGPQLQDRAIPGYPAEQLPAGITGLSERGGPIVVGLGFIDAIPDAAILAHEDPNDANGDGISGRANFVSAPTFLNPNADKILRDGKYLGRFGRKATAINLLQQTAGAYLNDMGVTSEFEPMELFNAVLGNHLGDNVADPEVATETINNVVFYLQTLRVPPRRNADAAEVRTGERIFAEIKCASCHLPETQTGPNAIAPLALQKVALYSDLLLHDMGATLADNYPEGEASGSEWRATPVWGLGNVGNVLGGT
ncbi:MAG: di-heme oxidoredictase family protein, partial [candidate division KSB1 bacterium]